MHDQTQEEHVPINGFLSDKCTVSNGTMSELLSWMAKNLIDLEVKSILDSYALDFAESSFLLFPPILDQFMDRRC